MKRNSLCLCIICLLLCAFVFVGCDGENENDTQTDSACTHEWGEWSVSTASSCSVAGKQSRKCTKCGEIQTETIELASHDYADATCTTPKTCKNCGAVDGEANGHSFIGATCTTPKACTVCGATEGTVKHNFIPATCTTPKVCTVCAMKEGEALGHTETVVPGKAPTCVDKGLSDGKKCDVCGKITVSQTEIPATGEHTYSEGICTVCGAKEFVCSHELTETVTVDLSKYGVCGGGKIMYKTCKCGEVSTMDADDFDNMDAFIGCSDDDAELGDFDMGDDYMCFSTICGQCNLKTEIKMVYITENCQMTIKTYLTLAVGKDTIISNLLGSETSTEAHENTETVTVNSSEYGACKGTIECTVCSDCGKKLSIDSIDTNCSIDLLTDGTETSYTDKDGYEHTIYTAQCATCKLTYKYDSYIIEDDTCYAEYVFKETCSRNGNVICECESSYEMENHNYECEAEFADSEHPCCTYGVYLTYYCTKCGDILYSDDEMIDYCTFGGEDSIETIYVGSCGSYILKYECEICGKVESIFYSKCEFNNAPARRSEL